jgi:transposase-like protein
MKERKEFSREFKLEAIRQLEEGRKNPAELARELGIRRNQLYKCRLESSWGSGLDGLLPK